MHLLHYMQIPDLPSPFSSATPSKMVPEVDFAPFLRNEGVVVGDPATPEQRATAAAIDAAFRSVGFIVLTNTIPTSEVEPCFEGARKMFHLPLSEKLTLPRLMTYAPYFGFRPPNSQKPNVTREPDLKEVFLLSNPDYVNHNFAALPDALQSSCKNMWRLMEPLRVRFAMACALALDLPSDFFLRGFDSSDQNTVAFNYFPAVPEEVAKSAIGSDTAALRVGEHTDYTVFTILINDGPGLQIKPMPGSEFDQIESTPWIDIPASKPNSVILNTGALMARITNNVWKAVGHRVIIPEGFHSKERMSIVNFVLQDADYVVSVHPKFVGEGEKRKYKDITAGDFVKEKLRITEVE